MKFENSKIYRKIFENRKVTYPLGIKQTAFLGEVNSPFAPKVKSKISFEGKSEVRTTYEGQTQEFRAVDNAQFQVGDVTKSTIENLNVYGKSEQKQYQGYNLFDPNNVIDGWIADTGKIMGSTEINKEITSDYIPLNYNENIYFNLSIITDVESPDCWLAISLFDESKQFISRPYGVHRSNELNHINTYLCNVSNAKYCRFSFRTYGNYNIKINYGTTEKPYEPYVGGIPSPNPDYPQEIKSVINPMVTRSGKNLIGKNGVFTFDIKQNGGTTYNFDKIGKVTTNEKGSWGRVIYKISNLELNKKYSILVNAKTDDNEHSHGIKLSNSNTSSGLNTSLLNKNLEYSYKTTFTYEENKSYYLWLYSNYTDVSKVNIMTEYEIMLVEGDVAPTTYEPYIEPKSLTWNRTLYGIPVSSGGNVIINGQQYISDYVDIENKKLWHMCELIDTTNMPSDLKFYPSSVYIGSIYLIGENLINHNLKVRTNILINKTQFLGVLPAPYDAFYKYGTSFYQQNTGTLNIWVKNGNILNDELDGLKILFQLITPYSEDLTDEEIQAYLEWKELNSGTSIITALSNELAPIIDFDVVTPDKKEIIDLGTKVDDHYEVNIETPSTTLIKSIGSQPMRSTNKIADTFDENGLITHKVNKVNLWELKWSKDIYFSNSFSADIIGIKRGVYELISNIICNIYEVISQKDFSGSDKSICVLNWKDVIVIKDNRFDSIEDFVQFLQDTQATLNYELAQPTYEQVAPIRLEEVD